MSEQSQLANVMHLKRYLDKNEIIYATSESDPFLINVSYDIPDVGVVTVVLSFDTEINEVLIATAPLLDTFNGAKQERILEYFNILNCRWKYPKFYLDDENAIVIETYAKIDAILVGEVCLMIVNAIVDAYVEAFPEIQRIINT